LPMTQNENQFKVEKRKSKPSGSGTDIRQLR
jgi:hypothetical protein